MDVCCADWSDGNDSDAFIFSPQFIIAFFWGRVYGQGYSTLFNPVRNHNNDVKTPRMLPLWWACPMSVTVLSVTTPWGKMLLFCLTSKIRRLQGREIARWPALLCQGLDLGRGPYDLGTWPLQDTASHPLNFTFCSCTGTRSFFNAVTCLKSVPQGLVHVLIKIHLWHFDVWKVYL